MLCAAGLTSTVQLADFPLSVVTVTVAVPTSLAVINPFSDTLATLSLLLVHVYDV
jgi:hypothetical protein